MKRRGLFKKLWFWLVERGKMSLPSVEVPRRRVVSAPVRITLSLNPCSERKKTHETPFLSPDPIYTLALDGGLSYGMQARPTSHHNGPDSGSMSPTECY